MKSTSEYITGRKMKCFIIFIIFVTIGCSTHAAILEVIDSGVGPTEQEQIVNIHNRLRIQIAIGNVTGQPRGVNLKRMQWDQKLADEAQKIADTGVFSHVKVHDDRWSVGQNLAKTSSTALSKKIDWLGVVKKMWFNEHEHYTYSTGTMKAGHYTQVVWHDSQFVGCGYTFYRSDEKYAYNKFYVCNYGPAGNIVGEYPYSTGSGGCENLC